MKYYICIPEVLHEAIVFIFSILSLLVGCQTATVPPDPTVLRVGVSPGSQPLIFKQGGQIMGIEADFARKLGQAINRRVVFVEVPWGKQIDYLEANRIDVIMSGMSITPARNIRINFKPPIFTPDSARRSGATTVIHPVYWEISCATRRNASAT